MNSAKEKFRMPAGTSGPGIGVAHATQRVAVFVNDLDLPKPVKDELLEELASWMRRACLLASHQLPQSV